MGMLSWTRQTLNQHHARRYDCRASDSWFNIPPIEDYLLGRFFFFPSGYRKTSRACSISQAANPYRGCYPAGLPYKISRDEGLTSNFHDLCVYETIQGVHVASEEENGNGTAQDTNIT
jgi:hypothetical protein